MEFVKTLTNLGEETLEPGSVLGRYELLMQVAQGGMAKVWAARLRGSRGFQKLVAIKTMMPRERDVGRFEAMFLREAELACRVSHPHVAQILDLGECNGAPFMVMEWVDGVPLHQLLRAHSPSEGIPLPVAVHVMKQAAGALHAAHELRGDQGELVGLVHRDVSPQNIMVTFDGAAKVVDFGIAKLTSEENRTQLGEVKGKLSFMAPEQLQGEAIDRRTDVFALGAVLYGLTTGRKPFTGSHHGETVMSICSPAPPAAPSSWVADYPLELEQVVLKALSKRPEDRYATADALLRALGELPSPFGSYTDEDVGQFVRAACGQMRGERNRALDAAQANADARAGKADRSPANPSGVYSRPLRRSETGSASGERRLPLRRQRAVLIMAFCIGSFVVGSLLARWRSSRAPVQARAVAALSPTQEPRLPNAETGSSADEAPPPSLASSESSPAMLSSLESPLAAEPSGGSLDDPTSALPRQMQVVADVVIRALPARDAAADAAPDADDADWETDPPLQTSQEAADELARQEIRVIDVHNLAVESRSAATADEESAASARKRRLAARRRKRRERSKRSSKAASKTKRGSWKHDPGF